VAYVTRLTVDPASMGPEDVEGLRQAGFGDADILGVCEVASYYAYVNRIAAGLGVELEPYARDLS
jgi:alkylhydroperoxidase family enzyme